MKEEFTAARSNGTPDVDLLGGKVHKAFGITFSTREVNVQPDAVRNWLGIYVLCLVVFLGGYLFLALDKIFPLENPDKIASFEIILPFLLAQLAAVYRFYTDPKAQSRVLNMNIPKWAVRLPPIFVTILIFISLTEFAFSGITRSTPPSPETFRGLVTFCMAILNASTVFVISRYFDSVPQTAAAPSRRRTLS